MLEFNFQPFPVLETRRLLLRKIVPADAAAIFHLKSDLEGLDFLDKAPMKYLSEAGSFIQKMIHQLDSNELIYWVICLKENPATAIGDVSFWRLIPEHYRAETGYMLNRKYWGKSIMTEALEAAISYAFGTMQLHSIEANTHPENIPSKKLLEKCGFVQEGYFRENYYYNGRFSDSAIYSLVNNPEKKI